MRQIEHRMQKAAFAGKDWREGNTAVENLGGPTVAVYLHGNEIATVNSRTGLVMLNAATFRNWPTRTTCSRLRALGIDASIKQGLPCIDGEPI